jgi:hypothetical protein
MGVMRRSGEREFWADERENSNCKAKCKQGSLKDQQTFERSLTPF